MHRNLCLNVPAQGCKALNLVSFRNLVPRVFWLFKSKDKIPWERGWLYPESPTKIP